MRDLDQRRPVKVQLSAESWQGVVSRAVLLACAVLAAFLVGNHLGHLRFGHNTDALALLASLTSAQERSRPSEAKSSQMLRANHADEGETGNPTAVAGITNYSSGRPRTSPSSPASHLTLRLRSVARISSAEVQAGERITFVTEESFEDASGRKVPAGSRVEGVIAQSTAASGASGRLVIEIHSLHVGNRALALRALPLAALGASLPATRAKHQGTQVFSTPAKGPRSEIVNLERIPDWRTAKSGPRATGTGLPTDTPAPVFASAPETGAKAQEAVVPEEAILEFELLQLPVLPQEIVPGQAPTFGEPQRHNPPAPVEWRPKSRPRTAHG